MKRFALTHGWTVPLLLASACALGAGSWYDGRSALTHRRTNGVKLVATASVPKAGPQRIEIQWSLDYTGPRQPLTILKPSLRLATCGQTQVIVYAQPKGGVPHEMTLKSPMQLDEYWIPKGWFLTVEKGNAATGTIEIQVSEVKDYFLKHWPERFQKTTPPALHIQLAHKPTDRGTQYHLDAWTGDLYGPVVAAKLAEW